MPPHPEIFVVDKRVLKALALNGAQIAHGEGLIERFLAGGEENVGVHALAFGVVAPIVVRALRPAVAIAHERTLQVKYFLVGTYLIGFVALAVVDVFDARTGKSAATLDFTHWNIKIEGHFLAFRVAMRS